LLRFARLNFGGSFTFDSAVIAKATNAQRTERLLNKHMTSISNNKDLDSALEQDLVFIYKHSTACPVSFRAKREVQSFIESKGTVAIYEVDVIRDRGISNEIADLLVVRHESPQILLIQNGSLIWNASHGQVTATNMIAELGNVENKAVSNG